jgi:membrane associated rhomboid family serine protease
MSRFDSFWQNIYQGLFKNNNKLYQLILINVVALVVIGLIEVIFHLFQLPGDFIARLHLNLDLSSQPAIFLRKPWTIITYMFMHAGFWHIIMNMLLLFWFGRIFQEYLRDKKLVATYIQGGIAGGLLYILAYQVFPALAGSEALMVGASASVLAIIVATATLLPNYSMNLLFFGPVKLKYIAIVFVLLDVLSLNGMENIGGHFAHLGGALYGFVYIKLYQSGTDISRWFTAVVDFFVNAFKPAPKPRFNVHKGGQYGKGQAAPGQKQTSKKQETPKKEKASGSQAASSIDQTSIDEILDKIAQSGYDSLSDKEKDVLFNASKS